MQAFSWRIWPDVSDLIALPMLVLGWRVFMREPATAHEHARERVLKKAALALVAFACVATSYEDVIPEPARGQVQVFSTTRADQPHSVRITQLREDVELNCETLLAAEGALPRLLGADLFQAAVRWELYQDDTASLISLPGDSDCNVVVVEHALAGAKTIVWTAESPGLRLTLVEEGPRWEASEFVDGEEVPYQGNAVLPGKPTAPVPPRGCRDQGLSSESCRFVAGEVLEHELRADRYARRRGWLCHPFAQGANARS